MNFFGHAWIASRSRADAAYVLGAMLPDLAQMAGTRLGEPRHAALREGVALHRRTDSVFHGTPTFVALYARAARELRGLGLARGMSRGAAHVAVELLIDGALVLDPHAARAYGAALDAAADPRIDAAIAWPRESRRVWRALRDRLRRGGPPLAYRDPAQVATRVARALAGRPRLALDGHSERVLLHEVARLRPMVLAELPRLMRDLESGLRERAPEVA